MKLVLISITVLGVLAPCTMAQGGFGRGNMTEVWNHLAAQYDKNKDGKITKEEYTRGEQKFDNWDSDGDGLITQSDLRNRGARTRGRVRNPRGNRRVNAGAADLVLARRVVRLADLDKDGKVTSKEWTAFVAKLDCNEDGLVSGEELNLSSRRFRMVKRIVDANRDGDVQVQELAGTFARLDRDKNKELSAAEIGGGGNRPGGGMRGNEANVPQRGQVAPDFDLPLAEQPKGARKPVTIKLSSFAGRRPVALIFGSYT